MLEFKEFQKFSQWWIWVLILGLGILPIYGIYQQLYLGEPFGDKPMSDMGLVLFTILMVTLIVLFLTIQLRTEITKYEIYFVFFPFLKKRIKWINVKHAKVVKYTTLGYGIRVGSKYGTIYNIKGNKGLAIELKNGKKLLIGTQKHREMSEVIDKILNPKS